MLSYRASSVIGPSHDIFPGSFPRIYVTFAIDLRATTGLSLRVDSRKVQTQASVLRSVGLHIKPEPNDHNKIFSFRPSSGIEAKEAAREQVKTNERAGANRW